MIKQIDKYVLKNFIMLFFATFFICSFILIMQSLWMNISEMVGKGIPIKILAEFFFYAWLSMVPLALPLAILLASLMSFGNMGERLELLAMKAAGISLFRIMRSLIIVISFVCVGAFAFSNNVIPIAQKKMWTLLFSIRQKSPELSIPVGEFYTGINSLHIYARHKDHKSGGLVNVMLYDFSNGFNNASVITADTVFMRMTDDKLYLKLEFINGEMFENMRRENSFYSTDNIPYRRESFKRREMLVEFDSNFETIDDAFLESQHVSKGIVRLTHDIDSAKVARDSIAASYRAEMTEEKYFMHVYSITDSVHQLKENVSYDVDSLFDNLPYHLMTTAVRNMRAKVSNMKNDVYFQNIVINDNQTYISRHEIEWYRKFTLSFACLIFFFIGAPLGAIIRKGGLGTPIVISVLMFIVYYIIDTTGVKMAREQVWQVWQGMWLSSFVLLPVGIFLTYKAAVDSALFNREAYKIFFSKLKVWIKIAYRFAKRFIIKNINKII